MSPLPGMPPQAPGIMPGPGPGPMMAPMMGMQAHPGQPNPPQRMPNMPGWHPGPGGPMGAPAGPRMPVHMQPQMPPASPAQQVPPQQPPAPPMVPPGAGKPPAMAAAGMGAGGAAPGGGGGSGSGGSTPHVKFDDNNPFSEGFQERERRERLREQQERQRVQLMQEVERQRALQKHMEMGMGAEASQAMPVPSPAPALGPRDPSLTQMPFYNSELPQDFLQPSRPTQQQQQQQQQQMGGMFGQPPQAGMDFSGAPGQGFMQGNQQRPGPGNGGFSPDMGPNYRGKSPMMAGHGFPQGQPRPAGFGGPGGHPQGPPQGDGSAYGMDSPSTPLPPNYPGSGQSLIQLYSNIIPEEKGKKKRSRKKKSAKDDDAGDSVRTPSTPHSDLTAPLTPRTPNTPTRASSALAGEPDLSSDPLALNQPGVAFAGLAPASELERQLSSVGGPGAGHSLLSRQGSGGGTETPERQHGAPLHQVKLEKLDASECHGPQEPHRMVKQEEAGAELASPNPGDGQTGNELLKHLLKNKSTPPPPPQTHPQHQTPPLHHQTSVDSLRSEDDVPNDNKSMLKMVWEQTHKCFANLLHWHCKGKSGVNTFRGLLFKVTD